MSSRVCAAEGAVGDEPPRADRRAREQVVVHDGDHGAAFLNAGVEIGDFGAG
ncbi:MAG TPA: hypothetical protein P5204_02930 [Kiritimatiellia bacterium]|nr:hypothetical protein [Kiritimatiellia bacterium]